MNLAESNPRAWLRRGDVVGIVRPAIDAHTLGGAYIAQQLAECGIRTVVAQRPICEALMEPRTDRNRALLVRWIAEEGITQLAYSFRLDPDKGLRLFSRFLHALRTARVLREHGGPLRALFFAGLPATCDLIECEHGERVALFRGDESPQEVLELLGVPHDRIPAPLACGAVYDRMRLQFGQDLVERAEYQSIKGVAREAVYPTFGTREDTLAARLRSARTRGLPPLMRAHCGPYLDDRVEALRLYEDWVRRLARGGLLDILSIGSSQLTQSDFGTDWRGKHNGGGVPVNSPSEFHRIWQAARPMLVRTYAGTRNVPYLSSVYETTLNAAWHALSFWWFNRIDGRGPNTVRENLRQHFETVQLIAAYGKPLEANVAHHFSFRGADDVTAIVSTVLAATAAKRHGIRVFVFQCMLNTPKFTWGVQDLAKARATLELLRELENASFKVVLQPRAGLAYFSCDESRARSQLAAVTAMMDDIEPANSASPPIIHVVAYTEGTRLADPRVIEESIKITRQALVDYRAMRSRGETADDPVRGEVAYRTAALVNEAKAIIGVAETNLPGLYSAGGFYHLFRAGCLPVPDLWEGREEFAAAASQHTRVINGQVILADKLGSALSPEERIERVRQQVTSFCARA